ncbi:phage tail protein [Mucilaginibacter sp.]
MVCDGRTLRVVDYPVLFALIGYNYGGSDANFMTPLLPGP